MMSAIFVCRMSQRDGRIVKVHLNRDGDLQSDAYFNGPEDVMRAIFKEIPRVGDVVTVKSDFVDRPGSNGRR